MQKWLTFAGGMLLGALIAVSVSNAVADHHAKKAYLVVAGKTIDATGLEAYRAKATPVAQKAGIKILGRNNAVTADHVLEGDYPYEGFLAVEEFSSMDALVGFWNSADYQAAIKLREGKVKLDFVVAVPSVGQ